MAAITRDKLLQAVAMSDEEIDADLHVRSLGKFAQPLDFDFDAPPEAPDWIVHGVIERGTVTILSGDTGAAKSIISQWLTVAALKGGDWFGRSTTIDRVLYIDEENPERLVRARLRAMGLSNAERAGLRYFSREGVTLGLEEDDKALRTALEEFSPDLLIVDTLMSASADDVLSNVAAVARMKAMRAIASEHGCAVLVMHHERKQQKDGPVAGSSQQSMGARQWVGQSDATLTIAVEADMQRDDLDGGGFKLRRTFKMRTAEKDRDGRLNGLRRIAVESEKDDRERLLWMTVSDEGPISQETAQSAEVQAIVTALADAEGDGVLTTRDLAATAGEDDPGDPSGTFRRALREAVESGRVEKVKRGHYRATETGTLPL